MFDMRKIQEQIIYNAVKAESNDTTAQEIVNHEQENNSIWVKNTMKRLEDNFDDSTIKKIRMNCQCGYGMDEKLALLKELMSLSSNLQEFASHEKANAAELSYCNNDLYLQFPFCPCPMVAEVDKLETNTWCLCTTGYSKVVFEKAFGCEVAVELLKSIKMGDDICLMKIVPLGTIQFGNN
jgi:predicted hydrocarbon binding protein